LSRLECHAGSMTQTNGWRNADYCYCHAKQNPGRLWRLARACGAASRKSSIAHPSSGLGMGGTPVSQ